jgi:ABC-type transport system involved in multi-copper enzyme maturation permease subunit
MTTAAATLKPVEALIAGRVDFPTWLPAMLVKELRQGLRAKGFVGTLVAFQVIMTLFTIFAIAGGSGSTSFGILQGSYWVVLVVQLLLITPGRALAGLQGELETRSIDLLLLTRLTAWRVVLGKWISLLVQGALLVVAMLPYGVARYFFGSVDLAGELKLIAMIFAGSAVLTAAALWSSAMPKVARIALGIGMVFVLQFIPGLNAAFAMMTGSRPGRGGPGISVAGAEMWLLVFNAALVLAVCLVGAVRKLAPRAESQSPLMRLLPLLAFVPVPFMGLRMATGQTAVAAVMFVLVAALELARPEEPMRNHWRAWARFGTFGRLVGRFVQPGWASAMEWLLVIAAATALGGLATTQPWKVAQLAMLGAEALIFPALLLTFMSSHFTQRSAGYVLVLGGASLIAAVGTASASVLKMSSLADLTLLLLPISSFWSVVAARTPPANGVLIIQAIVAAAVIGTAWVRARPYRQQRWEFENISTEPGHERGPE